MDHTRVSGPGALVALLGCVRVASAAPELEPDTLPVPPAPVATHRELALPDVPSFELPLAEAGRHDVRELRVRGRGLLGTELTVKGHVVWIYDCLVALAKPGVPIEDTRLLIVDNPQLCERPKFALGASRDATPDRALWVVDVPRPANKREQLALTKAQLLARPAVPKIAVGDLVAVTGTFTLRSPHGEQDSRGLLVFQKLVHLAPDAHASVGTGDAAPTPVVVAMPGPPIATGRPMRVVVPTRKRNESIEHYERCHRALVANQLAAAITDCRQALARWSGNHLAWYALGHAFATRKDWRAANDAYGEAVRLRPDAAMYQLHDAIASYEVAVAKARDDEARRRSGAPDPVIVALRAARQDATPSGLAWKPYRLAAALCASTLSSAAMFVRARRAYATAERLAPGLWLAPYQLGRLEREQDHAKLAAEAFTRAIRADPSQADPYIALIELYRAWDFTDESLRVARHASLQVTTGKAASLWYELGMAYEAKHREPDALAAFGKAIAAGSAQARFQRGQIYLRRGDLPSAERDLEAFLASADPSPGLARQIARSLLAEIQRQHREDRVYLRLPRHYEGE